MWGSVNSNPCPNWGSDSSSIWGDAHNSNMGFWDEAVKEAAQPPPQSRKSNAHKNSKGNANLRYHLSLKRLNRKKKTNTAWPSSGGRGNDTLHASSSSMLSCSNSTSSRANKKVEEEEKLLKLFQGINKSQKDTFMQWCEQTLHTLNTANNLDGKYDPSFCFLWGFFYNDAPFCC